MLHAVGVQGLRRDSEVPISQLRTAVSELYTALRTSHPALGTSQVQQAQELCLNWLMMAFQWSVGGWVGGREGGREGGRDGGMDGRKEGMCMFGLWLVGTS